MCGPSLAHPGPCTHIGIALKRWVRIDIRKLLLNAVIPFTHTHLLGHNISYCPGKQHRCFLFLLSRGNWRKKLEERAKVKTGTNQEVQANWGAT